MAWLSRWFGQSVPDREMLEACRKKLYRLAISWCRDPQLAEDLVQETMMKAWQRQDQLRQDGAGMAWMCQVMNNLLYDHLRQTGRFSSVELVEELLVEEGHRPDEACQQADAVRLVREAIACLPLAQRQVLTLVDLEEMSYEQVAFTLSIPMGTVMSRLSRARAALKQALQAQETKGGTLTYLRRVK